MSKRKKTKKERKLEKELLYIIWFVVFLIVLFVVASAIFKSFNTFEYEGLTFTKERLGEIPVFHYYYYFNNVDNELIKYNLYLRVDPRENGIKVEGNEILLDRTKVIFVSANSNSELNNCPYGVLGLANLVSFLKDNDFVVESGNLDFHDAKEKGESWITCETRSHNPVIEIKEGEETEININGNCYEITIASCEDFLVATEKFILQTIVDAQERTSSN